MKILPYMKTLRIGTLAGLLLLTGTLTAQAQGRRGCCGGNGWRQTAAQRQNTARRSADTCYYYGCALRQGATAVDNRERYCPLADSCHRREQCAVRQGASCPAGYDCREDYCRYDNRTAKARPANRRGYRMHRYGCDRAVAVRRDARPCTTDYCYRNGR